MDIVTFVDQIVELYDDIGDTIIESETPFRDVPSWSSIVGMSIIIMVDEEYGVKLRSDDIRGAHTIKDIYNKVKALKDLTA